MLKCCLCLALTVRLPVSFAPPKCLERIQVLGIWRFLAPNRFRGIDKALDLPEIRSHCRVVSQSWRKRFALRGPEHWGDKTLVRQVVADRPCQ